ncbi:unnamed protein product, partial [Cuscuta europaea]
MGNGQGLDIKYVGFTSFPSPYQSSISLSLKNILHVPSITKNLISVSQFAKDNNVYFEFYPYDCFVKSRVYNKVLLHGTLGEDGLYRFKSFPALGQHQPSTSSSLSTLSSTYNKKSSVLVSTCNNDKSCSPSHSCNLWHLRLGHLILRPSNLYFNIVKYLISIKMHLIS